VGTGRLDPPLDHSEEIKNYRFLLIDARFVEPVPSAPLILS
jgi:hypothetical protein